ncbi:MAG TPA: hemolysin family protein [Burkholderiaceae bacterium]|nr:hemolysin family protein [Burkholderiaceae bacterium]
MDVLLLLLLILLNAVFAMSEMAVVSSRKARLQRMADDGFPGAKSAMALNEEPSAFLSTVQVGITTIGILSGVVGEGLLASSIAEWLSQFAWIAPYAKGFSVAVVVAIITYLSVVIGELVPKRLALLAPERIASVVARPMVWLAGISRPLVLALSSSSNLLLRLLGARRTDEPPVTDDEIKVLMEQGAEAGVFHESEQAIVSNVLRLDDQRIGAIMTPRMDIHAIDLDEGEQEIRAKIAESPHSRVVVCRGGLEHILGVLKIGDLLKPALRGEALDVEKVLTPPLFVPETISTQQLLESFRKERVQFGLVVDEYGDLQGLVSLTDVLTSIVGDLPEPDDSADTDMVRREDGSWLVDGSVGIERVKQVLEIDELPAEDERAFHTVGGFAMHRLGRIPTVADHFDAAGYRFEVVDMDRNRVDKMLVAKLPDPTPIEVEEP